MLYQHHAGADRYAWRHDQCCCPVGVLDSQRGKTGRAVSPLRPSGVAVFDGRRIDVITEGLMVEPGQWVKCVEVRANKVLVRPADPPTLDDFENASFS